MELYDFNFCDCRYYSLDQYHRRKIEKAIKKGMKKVTETERTVFNDEEQRRYFLATYGLLISFLFQCASSAFRCLLFYIFMLILKLLIFLVV